MAHVPFGRERLAVKLKIYHIVCKKKHIEKQKTLLKDYNNLKLEQVFQKEQAEYRNTHLTLRDSRTQISHITHKPTSAAHQSAVAPPTYFLRLLLSIIFLDLPIGRLTKYYPSCCISSRV